MSRAAGRVGRRRRASAIARGRRAGQALVELAVAGPLLLLVLLVPLAAARWSERRLLALSAARAGAWEATVAPPARPARPPAGTRLALANRRGDVRAVATVSGGPAGSPATHRFVDLPPGPGPVEASLVLRVVPLEAGTVSAGRTAVQRRWLGGGPARPIRALLRRLIGEEPVRVDFDAVPRDEHR